MNNYLIKQLPKATVFINNDMQVVHASDKFISDFDFNNRTVLGTTVDKLFKHKNLSWNKILKDSVSTIVTHKIVTPFEDTKGNKKWFEVHYIPWHDHQENVIGAIIQTDDITKKVLLENRHEKYEAMLSQLSEVAKIGFWDYNLVLDEMYWSSKTKTIYEVDKDYIPNLIDSTNFFKNGHSRNTISTAVNKAITNETSFQEKLQLVTAKGNEIWVIISGKPLYKNNKFIGLVGTVQDVDELNAAVVKSKENEHLLRTLIDNLPLNVFIKDLESRKILVNKSEAAYCGFDTCEDLLGKNDFDIYDKETAEKSHNIDLMVMRDKKPILSQEMLHTKLDGTTTTFLTSKIPLLDVDGHAYGLVGISMDISDLKRKETELRKLIRVTSLQNDKLVNFTHIVSHNLRSHSANFSMLLNFLQTEESESKKQRITEMLMDSSNNLMETLNNLNQIVDINIKTGLQHKPIVLRDKIKNIEQILSADIITNMAKVINRVPSGVTIRIVPAYIDSILINFITNSIKYKSPHRNPVIELSTSQEEHYTVLSIKDNGLGIDLEKYGDKLFGMYKTFHEKENARGFGLFITKTQIEAMNGKVTVESTVGKGSTFKIYFNENN